MTPAQLLRLRGWKASLQQRGFAFSCASGDTFTGLLEHRSAELDTFELGPEQRIDGVIHVARDDFENLAITEQTTVTGAGKEWFVKRIEDNPANILVLLHCTLEDDNGSADAD